MPRTAAELALLHLEALYDYDDAGQILRVNERIAAPRLHLVRTPDGNRWRFGGGCDAAVRGALERALASEPVVAGVDVLERRAPRLDVLRAALRRQAPPANEYRGPAYVFPERLPPQSHAPAVQVVGDPRELTVTGAFAWLRDATDHERPLVVAHDASGSVVAICHSARSSPQAAEAGVETDAASRRAGYGIAVVAAWAEAVRAAGRVPLYSTWWGNAASRALAARLGLICYGEDLHID